MPRDQGLVWYHTDEGLLPPAARAPWTKTGSQVASFVDDGLEILDALGVEKHTYHRQVEDSDTALGPVRARDVLEVQAYVRGVSTAPAWASGQSPIGLWIDDGQRALALVLGSTVALVDPASGALVMEVADNQPWLFGHVWALRKIGSERWAVYRDGQVLGTAPYDAAASSTALPAVVGFGCLDIAGSARGVFEAVEAGCNRPVPVQWKVDRAFNAMPRAVAARWNALARAALRATVGLVQGALEAMYAAWTELLAGQHDLERFVFAGDVLPNSVTPAWSLVGGTWSIERQRLRCTKAAPGSAWVRAQFSSPVVPFAAEASEHMGVARWTVRTSTSDGFGRVGPYMRVVAHGHHVHAQLRLGPAGGYEWVLTDAVLFGGPVIAVPGAEPWPVDPFRVHQVQLQVLGESLVLLLVDGAVVDRQALASFPNLGGATAVRFGLANNALCTVDLEDGLAVRRLADQAKREAFLQECAERLVFVGGCERNQELDTWLRNHRGMETLRGTTAGIRAEVKHLACETDHVYVVADQQPAAWYLERSWPEVTPIYLELYGFFADVYVEFAFDSKNFTPEQLAALIVRYIVPVSVTELTYYAAIAAVLTGPAVAISASETNLPVISSRYFATGDVVTVRDPDYTASEETTVLSVPSATDIRVGPLTHLASYPALSLCRKILAQS